jgi:TPR repeat protein
LPPTAPVVVSFPKATESGDAITQTYFGKCEGVDQYREVVERAAAQGDATAQYEIGRLYAEGEGVERDDVAAVKWLRMAADQGHAIAQWSLGSCYCTGRGVKQNLPKAVEWYRKAAEQGNPDGQYALGICYDRGKGVRQDQQEAVKWYGKAADQDDDCAQFQLGVCYANGNGVEQDLFEAIKWYRMAAHQRHPAAQCSLGNCYAAGISVQRNLAAAAWWWHRAEEQGYPVVYNNLDFACDVGEESHQREVVNWFLRAPQQGFAYAQCSLGFGYTIDHALEELISNAQDEKATRIDVRFEHVEGRRYSISVEDDLPEGFRELADADSLFTPSRKKNHPTKRGRFNFGEKWVIAICDSAKISSMTGTISWEDNEVRYSRVQQAAGTLFEGHVTSNRREHRQVCQKMLRIISNDGVVMTFNGRIIEPRKPVVSFEATLPTIIVNEKAELVRTERQTTVNLYEVREREEASLYERGIPVVKTGDLYHYDVRQKVPPSLSRDNVPASFLKLLRTLTLDQTHNLIPKDKIRATWVREGLEDAKPETVASVLDKTFGKQRAIADPSDREAEDRLTAEGFTIIPADAFNTATWRNIMATGAAQAAGMIRPTAKSGRTDLNAQVKTSLDANELTPAMKLVEQYAVLVAKQVVGSDITVAWVNDVDCPFSVRYGPRGSSAGAFDFNVARLGHGWFDRPPATTWEIESLLLHEFGRHRASNHLSEAYCDALAEYGARLSALKLQQPELFAKFR